MSRKQKAAQYFQEGYNCCQSVALAFLDETGLTGKQLIKATSPFGGGMAGLREVCGAVTGMFLCYGLILGNEKPEGREAKQEERDILQQLAEEFRRRNGSILCKELLEKCKEENKNQNKGEYFSQTSCGRYVEDAADILDQYLEQKKERG